MSRVDLTLVDPRDVLAMYEALGRVLNVVDGEIERVSL